MLVVVLVCGHLLHEDRRQTILDHELLIADEYRACKINDRAPYTRITAKRTVLYCARSSRTVAKICPNIRTFDGPCTPKNPGGRHSGMICCIYVRSKDDTLDIYTSTTNTDTGLTGHCTQRELSSYYSTVGLRRSSELARSMPRRQSS